MTVFIRLRERTVL